MAASVAGAIVARREARQIAESHRETSQALAELQDAHADLMRSHDERTAALTEAHKAGRDLAASHREARALLLFAGRVAEGVGVDLLDRGEDQRAALWLAHALKLVCRGADEGDAQRSVRNHLAICLGRCGVIAGAGGLVIPTASTESSERIELWTQVVTGLEIGADGVGAQA